MSLPYLDTTMLKWMFTTPIEREGYMGREKNKIIDN
jgi:hypothetical protein